MILADKIIDLRKKNGWSQEELAEKLDVSRQSISKWEGAQSVPDMARILRMSQLFGVSTDYLLKDELECPEPVETGAADSALRTVSMEEASRFLAVKHYNAGRVALGVMMCILSPVLLILLGGAAEFGKLALTESQVGGAGLTALLLLVGGAVALFVACDLRTQPYEYLEKEPIETLYGVDGMVRERREAFHPTYARQLTVGIVLCVLSGLPLFLSLLVVGEGDSFTHVAALGALLCMVAVGVLLIVRVAVIWGSFQMLLEQGEYSREAKAEQKRIAPIIGIYWLAVTAGYLAWSFLTMGWDRTWIVWPVAGVSFGIVMGLAKLLRKRED